MTMYYFKHLPLILTAQTVGHNEQHRQPSQAIMPAITTPRATFHDLPPELRNEIYTQALIQENPVRLPYSYEKIPSSEPPLLSVDRAIHAEATPIYYGANTFEAPSLASALDFLQSLTPQKIACLRNLHPIDLVLPATAHRRWYEALSANINKMVRVGGKGALSPEAVWILTRDGGYPIWKNMRDIQEFEVVDEEGGGWRIERHAT